ncbi:cation transporter [Terasakiella sp. A23]|uniref:cation transporter n=1 Tax=Terasakiella sp. FCG-A23 TaxID=3080561 RepID=UPI00295592DC|nr:cation transporter [Terasakiella sp. A23]MDV7338038.1 cation transporter [Terasakiella sp. A23]
MSAGCQSCSSDQQGPVEDKTYRRILWFALITNALMFLVELIAGALGQSLALTADAMDFFSDAANYAITLVVLGMSLTVRAKAALFKGICMGLVGLYVFYSSVSHIIDGTVPRAEVMGIIGFLALVTNVVVALLLYRHRGGDANRQSIWICSRNDAIANIAVMAAGLGVWTTTSGWPDILVGLGIAGLGLWGAGQIISKSYVELCDAQK